MSREGVPLLVIQRQLGHANLSITSLYLLGIDNTEIIHSVQQRPAPMIPATKRTRSEALVLRRSRNAEEHRAPVRRSSRRIASVRITEASSVKASARFPRLGGRSPTFSRSAFGEQSATPVTYRWRRLPCSRVNADGSGARCCAALV
jgi:hypothetical protein